MTRSRRASDFGPVYYAENAAALGWDADHAPDAFKADFLSREVLGERVLDIGSGPGVYAGLLSGSGRRLVTFDFAPSLLAAGRRRVPALAAVCGSATALPFADDSFDTTLLLSILEHGDDSTMLREALRVTRQRVIVQVPLAEPEFVARAGLLFSHWSDRSHLRTYGEASLRSLAERAGGRFIAFIPAYHRDLTELYLSSLAIPRFVRGPLRILLDRFRSVVASLPAEGFAIVEPR